MWAVSDKAFPHVSHFFEMSIEHRCASCSQCFLHVRDLIFAFALDIADITELLNFIPEHAVKCGSGFEQATIVTSLPDLLADRSAKLIQCCVVWAKC